MDSRIDVPYLKQVTVTSPAVGADWRHTCPGQGIQRILALRTVFTASAAVATRVPILTLSDGSDDYASVAPGSGTTAGATVRYSTIAGAGAQTVLADTNLWPSPHDGWLLLPGWSLRTVTAAIDVGDQWSAIRLWVAEYPTGPEWRLTPDVTYFVEPKG